MRLFGLVPGTVNGALTAFAIIQTPLGTSPTADNNNDTLNLTSSDNSVTITGDSTTDTVNFVVNTSAIDVWVNVTGDTMTGLLTINRDNIDGTSTQALLLQNQTAATSGVTQQLAPCLDFIGHAWQSLGGSDRLVRWRTEGRPVSSASASGVLSWSSSIDTGTASFTDRMTLTTAGQLALPATGINGGILVGADVQLYRTAADEWRTPDSLTIDSRLAVGTSLSSTSGANILFTTNSNVTGLGLLATNNVTGAITSAFPKAITGSVSVNAGSNTISYVSGISGSVRTETTQSGAIAQQYGFDFDVWHRGSANITTLAAARALVSVRNTSSGTITLMIGYRANLDTESGGTNSAITDAISFDSIPTLSGTSTITRMTGLLIRDPTGSQTINTHYGIRILDLTRGTTNFALHFDGTSGLARQGVWWNADTNLYRSAANTLKTDDALVVALKLTAETELEVPNGAGGTTVNEAGEVTVDTTSATFNFHDGTLEAVLNPIQSKSITIETPSASEDLSMFYTDDAITVTKLVFVITGTTSVTTTIRHSTDRSAAGNEVVTGGTVANNSTTGNVVTTFNDATIPADSFVWLETTALSGTPTSVSVTVFYRQDA